MSLRPGSQFKETSLLFYISLQEFFFQMFDSLLGDPEYGRLQNINNEETEGEQKRCSLYIFSPKRINNINEKYRLQ